MLAMEYVSKMFHVINLLLVSCPFFCLAWLINRRPANQFFRRPPRKNIFYFAILSHFQNIRFLLFFFSGLPLVFLSHLILSLSFRVISSISYSCISLSKKVVRDCGNYKHALLVGAPLTPLCLLEVHIQLIRDGPAEIPPAVANCVES
jgi:hypothetical protein